MSSRILNKTVNLLNAKAIKLLPMSKRQNGGPPTLGDVIKKIREERKLSLKDVERDSAHGVSSGYVSQLENDLVESPTVNRLTALGKGLGLGRPGIDELFAIARGIAPPEGFSESWFHELYEGYKRLSEPQHVAKIDEHMTRLLNAMRTALEEMEILVRTYPKTNAEGASVAPIRKK